MESGGGFQFLLVCFLGAETNGVAPMDGVLLCKDYFNARVAKMQCRPGRGTTALTAWIPVLDGRLNARQMGNKPLINATRCAITGGTKADCGLIVTFSFDPLADRREEKKRGVLLVQGLPDPGPGRGDRQPFLPCDQLACPPQRS